jgi:hypothetical protein
VALEGSLKDFGLADILQLIFFQRKTGVLTLESRLDKVRLLVMTGHRRGGIKRRIEANRLGKVMAKKAFSPKRPAGGARRTEKFDVRLGTSLYGRDCRREELKKSPPDESRDCDRIWLERGQLQFTAGGSGR